MLDFNVCSPSSEFKDSIKIISDLFSDNIPRITRVTGLELGMVFTKPCGNLKITLKISKTLAKRRPYLNNSLYQGSLTEGEGSVQLTSLF